MTEQPKPCGCYHPLPCGLDVDCSVPVRNFNNDKTSQQIWSDYND